MNHQHHHHPQHPGMATTPTNPLHQMMNSSMKNHPPTHGALDHSEMMQMTFYFGVVNVPILFKGLTVNSSQEMVAACIGVCIVAMLYEGLKVLREALLRKSTEYRRVASDSDQANLIRSRFSSMSMCASSHWLQTFLHFIQVTVSYALMLIFMTYNGYLAISILIGASLGYFLFGWKKAVIVDINEHCH